MENESINASLFFNDKIEEAIITIMIGDDSIEVSLESDLCSITKEGENLFDIIIQIRKELEKRNIKLLCKACSRNVHPSGMILGMGYGRMAYSLVMGRQALSDSLIDIFSPCTIEEYSNVKEQDEFFEKWCKSLRKDN